MHCQLETWIFNYSVFQTQSIHMRSKFLKTTLCRIFNSNSIYCINFHVYYVESFKIEITSLIYLFVIVFSAKKSYWSKQSWKFWTHRISELIVGSCAQYKFLISISKNYPLLILCLVHVIFDVLKLSSNMESL